MEQVKLWQPNSLPVPHGIVASVEPEIQSEEEVLVEDNFPKGRIEKYFPNQGYGFIRDRAERKVYFTLDVVEFVGSKGEESLESGKTVGYDVAHSGKGLHVKKLKIY